MMMKKILKKIFILCSCALPLVSCNDWLNVVSGSQVSADDLFETRSGYYEALTGVYINMGANCYGQNYTWFVNDLTSYPYQQSSTNLMINALQNHLYSSRSDVKTLCENMWRGGYNVIANINIILENMENHQDLFYTSLEYNLIRGELLGLRAYLHFDLMRMFGVSDWSGDNASKLTVPYVTVFDKEPVPQKSYSETEALLLADVNEALSCLQSDPVRGSKPDNFDATVNADGYWNNRTKHLNYYALKALAARIYQWKKDYDTASGYADDVISSVLDKNVVSWLEPGSFAGYTSDDKRDWTFSCEHVFSLEVTGLWDNVSSYLFETSLSSPMRIEADFIDNILYQRQDATGSLAGSEDVRGPVVMMKSVSSGYNCYKLYGSTNYSNEYRNRMPMIRLSEMYYIMAEACIMDGNPSEALALLDEVRSHRGVQSEFPATADAPTELMKEYYREFVNEGQLFYWLKHNNVTSSLFPSFAVTAADLVYPYPDEETSYGRVQEL